MNKEKILAILFKREIINAEEDQKVYKFTPIEIIEGKELDTTKTSKISISSSNIFNKNKRISYMEDINHLNDEYVYGFEIRMNANNEDDIITTKNNMEEIIKLLEPFELFQHIDMSDHTSKIYLSNQEIHELKEETNFANLLYIIKRIISKNEDGEIKKEDDANVLYVDDMYDFLKNKILFQDEALKMISSTIISNSIIEDVQLRNNILVIGNNGVGKNEIFNTIFSSFDIPAAFEDYDNILNGKSLNDALIGLIYNSNEDVTKAQKGIIIIDNVENMKPEDLENPEVANLYKMVEGYSYGLISPDSKPVTFDTSFLTFVFLLNPSKIKNSSIGFNTKSKNDILNDLIENNTILKNTSKIYLNDLTINDLEEIIKNSDISQLQLYRNFLELNNISLNCDDKTIKEIATSAFKLKKGAKGIKDVVNYIFELIKYDILKRDMNYSELTITPETVHDNKKYILK